MGGSLVATGRSSKSDARAAAEEAMEKARARLGAAPAFGLAFVGPSHGLSTVLRAAQRIVPETPLIGATTAGELTEEGVTHEGVTVVLVSGDDLLATTAFAPSIRAPADAAEAVGVVFRDLEQQARKRGLPCSATISLVDGLVGTGEPFVAELLRRTRPFHTVVGGAAGDEGKFLATEVGAGNHAGRDAAACLHVFSRQPWGVGVKNGLTATPQRMTVTRAEGNVVREIDGKPAFDVYRAHAAARGLEITPDTAATYMIEHQLGVFFLDELAHARTPLKALPDGSLTLAGSLERGSSLCLLEADADTMIDAARLAARDALAGLKGAKPAGVLVFDCICRGVLLKRRLADEVQAIREELGNVPVAGFLTYGEIGRGTGRLSAWHNSTAVVVALPA